MDRMIALMQLYRYVRCENGVHTICLIEFKTKGLQSFVAQVLWHLSNILESRIGGPLMWSGWWTTDAERLVDR